MHGTPARNAVDPVGDYIVGVVVAGAMRARRGRERFVFGPREVSPWDPSAANRASSYGRTR
jgi:hypothetical protein